MSDVDDAVAGLGPVALVREGADLHYGRPRAFSTDDPDLALLAGDRCYALGLERLAANDDLETIAALCDVITRCAQAHVAGRTGVPDDQWPEAKTRPRHVGP